MFLFKHFTCSFTGCHRCVCEKHQNMALSVSANGLAACNRLRRASLPSRECAFKNGKVEKQSGSRSSIYLVNSSGVTGQSLWGTLDPEKGRTLTDRQQRISYWGASYRDKIFCVSYHNIHPVSCSGSGVSWDQVSARFAAGRLSGYLRKLGRQQFTT